jgi:hypothetical protein
MACLPFVLLEAKTQFAPGGAVDDGYDGRYRGEVQALGRQAITVEEEVLGRGVGEKEPIGFILEEKVYADLRRTVLEVVALRTFLAVS